MHGGLKGELLAMTPETDSSEVLYLYTLQNWKEKRFSPNISFFSAADSCRYIYRFVVIMNYESIYVLYVVASVQQIAGFSKYAVEFLAKWKSNDHLVT